MVLLSPATITRESFSGSRNSLGGAAVMKTITIKDSAEFIAFCRIQHAEPVQVTFATKTITLPVLGTVLRRKKNVELVGPVTFTGGRFSIISSENITCRRIAFRAQRPEVPPSKTYEKSWKPFAIQAEAADQPCRNITIDECSFSGNTDEIESGPEWAGIWFASYVGKPTVIGLTVTRCMIGPSFQNYLTTRVNHNFGWAFSMVKNLTVDRCVVFAANRRQMQIAATNAVVRNCVCDNWGTMGLGLHAGTDIQIHGCHFIQGPQTKELPISLVEGTYVSPLARLGLVKVAISPTNIYYDKAFLQQANGEGCWREPLHDLGNTWQRQPLTPVEKPVPMLEIVNGAGCGDSLDVAIRNEFAKKRHIPWMAEYAAPFTFPK